MPKAAYAVYRAEAPWPDRIVCPSCDHAKGWPPAGEAVTIECAGCDRQTSVTDGTEKVEAIKQVRPN